MSKKKAKNTKHIGSIKSFYENLELEMTQEEKDRIEKAADINRISVSQFVSDALSGFIIEDQKKEIRKLKRQNNILNEQVKIKQQLIDVLDEVFEGTKCQNDTK